MTWQPGRRDQPRAPATRRDAARGARTPPLRAGRSRCARSRRTRGTWLVSLIRNAADRSTTQPTSPTSCGASCIDASCGSPRMTRSRPADVARVELAEDQVRVGGGQRRVQIGGSAPRHRVAGGEREFQMWMRCDEAQELGAGVAGGADDADTKSDGFRHSCMTIHTLDDHATTVRSPTAARTRTSTSSTPAPASKRRSTSPRCSPRRAEADHWPGRRRPSCRFLRRSTSPRPSGCR